MSMQPMQSAIPAITLQAVSKTFLLPHEQRDTLKENLLGFLRRRKRTYEDFHALKDISLQIPQGEFIGVLGKNGSGKSTLLKIMAGIYHPTDGTVRVQGSIAPFLELGIGFQPELTGRENIQVNGTLLGMNRQQIRQRFEEMVRFAELEKFLDLKVKNYSSGMRARLAFAIAKEADADIYLCDEVLAVGDEAFQQKCLQVFADWKSAGKTVVLVSHNASQVEDLCDRAVLLEGGMVTQEGPAGEVVAAYHERTGVQGM